MHDKDKCDEPADTPDHESRELINQFPLRYPEDSVRRIRAFNERSAKALKVLQNARLRAQHERASIAMDDGVHAVYVEDDATQRIWASLVSTEARAVLVEIENDQGSVVEAYEPSVRSSPVVPAAGEFLLSCFLSADTAEAMLGDLEERFHRRAASRGERHARWWYWAQVTAAGFRFALLWAQRLGAVDAVLRRIGL